MNAYRKHICAISNMYIFDISMKEKNIYILFHHIKSGFFFLIIFHYYDDNSFLAVTSL